MPLHVSETRLIKVDRIYEYKGIYNSTYLSLVLGIAINVFMDGLA